jgi:hypothetical protein
VFVFCLRCLLAVMAAIQLLDAPEDETQYTSWQNVRLALIITSANRYQIRVLYSKERASAGQIRLRLCILRMQIA